MIFLFELLLALVGFHNQLLQFLFFSLDILDAEKVGFLKIIEIFNELFGFPKIHLFVIQYLFDLLVLSAYHYFLEIGIKFLLRIFFHAFVWLNPLAVHEILEFC